MPSVLFPAHVTACVLDPEAKLYQGQGTTCAGHGWSWTPMPVERLVSGQALPRLLDPRLDTPPAPPFPVRGGAPRPAVCLSWAPPAPWGRELPDGSGLPRIPDRWLIVRIARPITAGDAWTDGTAKAAAWVIDAGVAATDPDAAKVLVREGEALVPRGVGVRRTLAVAAEAVANEPRVPLTLRGAPDQEDLAFASFVPSNLCNLSCLDDLADVDGLDRCSLSYVVIGWYRAPEHDPLRRLRGVMGEDQLRAALGVPKDEPLGEQCIFHGQVAHIDYFDSSSYGGPGTGAPRPAETRWRWSGVPMPTVPEVGFGASSSEALAALLAGLRTNAGAYSKEFGRLLEALLGNAADTFDVPGAEAEEAIARTAGSFESVSGGRRWSVRAGAAKGTRPASGAAGSVAVLDVAEQALLDQLNAAQVRLDAVRQQLGAAAETLYTLWWNERNAQQRGGDTRAQAEVATAAVERYRRIVKALTAAAARDEVLAPSRTALRAALDKRPDGATLEIVAGDASRFHVAKEPVVALAGLGAAVPVREPGVGARSPDRVGTKRAPGWPAIDGLALASELGDGQDGALPAAVDALAPACPDPVVGALLREAALAEAAVVALSRIDRAHRRHTAPPPAPRTLADWVDRAAALFHHLDGAATPPVRMLLPRPEDERKLAFLDGAGRPTLLRDVCTAWGRQPWSPLFLDWEVELPATSTKLSGRTLLANQPQRVAAERLARLTAVDRTHRPRLAQLLELCGDSLREGLEHDVLAQSLGGLHQQLVGRDDALPRLLPAGELGALVEHTSLAPPATDRSLHLTLREGELRISRLRVVDRFGQTFELRNPLPMARPEQLVKVPGQPARLRLAPRFFEPTRLGVQFRGARPGTPVFGWLVLNRLDGTLVVYDADGAPLGLVHPRGGAGMAWRRLETTPAVEPRLKALLDALLDAKGGRAAFDALTSRICAADAANVLGEPEGEGGARLLGRPLALVTATVALEHKVPPQPAPSWLANLRNRQALAQNAAVAATLAPLEDPRWEGLAEALTKQVDALQASLAAVLKVPPRADTVTLTVGGGGLRDDGIVAVAPGDAPGSFAAPPFTTQLGSAEGVELTLLLDPHRKLPLTIDRLPTLRAELPSTTWRAAYTRLPAVLRLQPILLPSVRHLDALGTPEAAPVSLVLPVRASGEARLLVGGSPARVSPPPALPTLVEDVVAAVEAVLLL